MKLYEPAPGFDQPPAGECRDGMRELWYFIRENWGADFLGCYADRPKTSGRSPSLHRDGRAIDVGFDGRLQVRELVYEWLIEHADPLNIQMVLNYQAGGYGGTRWRLPYNAGDANAGRGTWSRPGHWLHIERTLAGADDPRPIPALITPPSPPPPTRPPSQEDSTMKPTVIYVDTRLRGRFALVGGRWCSWPTLEVPDGTLLLDDQDHEWTREQILHDQGPAAEQLWRERMDET